MKRILSWVLAMVLLLSCMPAGAVQAESLTQTVQPQPVQEVAAQEETTAFTAVSAVAAEPESLDNRQLLEGYAYSLFYGQIATFGRKAGDRLTGDEKLIYDALVPIIKQIAAGERTSTVIGLGQTVSDQNGNQYVADAEVTFTGKSLDNAALQRILSALLTDLPYDLYWYDKVTGAKSISLAPPDGILVHFQLTLAVADNYQGSGEYTVDSAEARAAVAAAEKSAAILAKYASASDYEKLLGYKEEICSLVTYDRTAADAGNFSLDDDPWQLIHVFDGNTATNVVCEGYSKAFMYLCEQTDFAGDVSCITVTGIMGGAHMWNIVTLEGKNYLVDVTNSEPGTVGADGSLFLAGGTGSVLSGYTVGGKVYSYMDKAEGTDPDIALWGSDASSILTLAAENYTPKTTNIVASGTCGDNLTWTLDDTGTLTISGTGPMHNFAYDGSSPTESNHPWKDVATSIQKVVLESGVTRIGNYAFEYCTSITAIAISDDVTSIGLCAFEGCTSLTNITIPDSVTTIGGSAFRECTGLTTITIPDSVSTIGGYVFEYCTGLTSATIGNSITTIEECAFMYCTGLTSVTIGNSVTTIEWDAFRNCTDLTTITIPDSVTNIGDYAFGGCTGLEDVYYGGTETQWQQIGIGKNNECLTNANIHFTNTFIASGTCGDNLTWTLDDAGTLTISGTGIMEGTAYFSKIPWYNVRSSIKQVVIEKGVTTIGVCAFYDCSRLTSITIPDSVTTIGHSAFSGCTGLTSVSIPNSVTTIGNGAFGGCSNLVFNEYENVLYLGNAENPYHALIRPSNENLPQYNIHDDAQMFANSAFAGCSNLISITIPDSVTSIGYETFSGCTGLTSVSIPNSVTTIGYMTFNECASLTAVIIPNSVTTIDDCAFYWCTGLTSITIPDSVTTIGTDAFCSCKGLTSITIPNSVINIGDGAFINCSSLTSVTIGNGITSIDYETFWNCTALTSVTIPDSVTNIGRYAFNNCTALKNVYYSGTKNQWKAVKFDENNTAVTNAPYIHYNCATADSHWTDKKVTPSCTEKGYTAHTCKCGYSYKIDQVKALGHNLGSWVIAQKPTCTIAGIKRRQCMRCDHFELDYISTTSHKYTSKVVKPTPTAKGYTLHTCACGNSYKDTYTPALNLSAPKVSISLNASTGKQVLTWKSGGDGITYEIHRATSKSGKYSKVGTAKTATWTDTSASVGKTYYYKVKAVYGDRSSSFSNIVSKAAVCGAPDVTVTLKKGKPYISWKKVTSAKKYDVYYATSKTGKYKKLTTTTSKSYTHSKASTGSQYFYKVRAVGSKSSYTGSYSAIESCWVTCVAPTVTASNDATTGYPILKWKAVTGAKQYDVYRRVAGKGKYVKIGSTSGKTYTDKSAVANTKYDYQVQTVGKKSQLNSPMSDKDTIICKVAAPVITVKLNAEGKPVISWKAVKGAKSYKVYRSTKATKSYKKLSGGKLDVKNGTYTDTSAAGGKTYYYKVVAVGSGNESGYSNYKKATAKCSVPALKVKLSSNKPVLSWKKVDGAKKYEIQFSTDGKTFKKLTTTNKTSYTHKASAGTYYYKIKALGSKSSYNSSFSAATKAIKVK